MDGAASASASASSRDDMADAQADAHSGGSVSPKSLKTQQADAADAADARLPPLTSSPNDDLDIPAFLRRPPPDPRRCDHCGQPATPTDPLNLWDWDGRPDGILLHARCETPWAETEGSRP